MKTDTETLRYNKQFKTVLGKRMAYLDEGTGDPIDMIGMDDIDKLENTNDGNHSLAENTKYTSALLDALGVNKNVTLVLHDWGSGVGFNWENLCHLLWQSSAFFKYR
jgi:haloalkane dehalogenase